MSIMRVLLTGGAGFIGSHVALLLLERGLDVLILDSFSNSSSSLIQAKIMGNIVFLLLTPLSYLQLFFCIFDCRNSSRYVCRYLHLPNCNVLC